VQVTQARLDYQDGVMLHLLGSLIRIFDAANASDRRIPRLFPSSTYTLFRRKRPTDPAEAETTVEEPEEEEEESTVEVEPSIVESTEAAPEPEPELPFV
jgi:hypothetical protein